jgi:hypothetical protein
MTILLWLIASIIIGLIVARMFERNEIDAHEEMTLPSEGNNENRFYHDC